MVRSCVCSRNLKNDEAMIRVGPQRHKENKQTVCKVSTQCHKTLKKCRQIKNKIDSNEKSSNLKIFAHEFTVAPSQENATCIRVGGNIIEEEKLTEIGEESFVDRFYNDTPPVAQ